MRELKIRTRKKREVIDNTQKVENLLESIRVMDGIIHIFVTHTTAALTTADLDPGTNLDMLDAFYEMIPKLKYRIRMTRRTFGTTFSPHL